MSASHAGKMWLSDTSVGWSVLPQELFLPSVVTTGIVPEGNQGSPGAWPAVAASLPMAEGEGCQGGSHR